MKRDSAIRIEGGYYIVRKIIPNQGMKFIIWKDGEKISERWSDNLGIWSEYFDREDFE